jgi:hypothetical protein
MGPPELLLANSWPRQKLRPSSVSTLKVHPFRGVVVALVQGEQLNSADAAAQDMGQEG